MLEPAHTTISINTTISMNRSNLNLLLCTQFILTKYVVYLDLYNSLYQAWQACQDSNQLTMKYNQMKK